MTRLNLVLVPGLACDGAVWAAQHAALAHRVNIVVADHDELDSIEAMATRVLASCRAPFAVAGHSMGGRVALEVWRQAPDLVTGLALLDTGCSPVADGIGGAEERAGRYALLELARREGMRVMAGTWVRGMVHPRRLDDEQLTGQILDMFDRKTPDIFEAQIKALLSRPDARSLIATISCPTLVLCGADDAWAPPDRHRDIAAAIRGSALRVIPDCGHMAPLEQPDRVTDAMGDWLDRLGV